VTVLFPCALYDTIRYTVSKRLAWTVFHRNSSQSDADKIRTIKELLSLKAGLVALSSFDASQVDFMIQTLCTQ